MEINIIDLDIVKINFSHLKEDLIDEFATYLGCIIDGEVVGIVSYVEHELIIYLCHDYIHKG
jgi:hypothetical protein